MVLVFQEFSTLMKDISDVITGKSDGGPNQMGGLLGTVASPDTFGGKTAAAYATVSTAHQHRTL